MPESAPPVKPDSDVHSGNYKETPVDIRTEEPVRIRFSETGKTLEDALRDYFLRTQLL